MIQQILPFLSRYVPAAMALKGISKVSPRLSSAITAATAAGFGTDAILDYLRNSMEPEAINQKRQQYSQGASQGTLRPDEISNKRQLDEQSKGLALPIAGAALGGGLGALMGGQNEEENYQPQQEFQSQTQQPISQSSIPQEAPNISQQAIPMARNQIQNVLQSQKPIGPIQQLLNESKAGLQSQQGNQMANQRMQPKPQQSQQQPGKSQADAAILAALEKILSM
jgi:hypothetical protein